METFFKVWFFNIRSFWQYSQNSNHSEELVFGLDLKISSETQSMSSANYNILLKTIIFFQSKSQIVKYNLYFDVQNKKELFHYDLNPANIEKL